LELLIIDKMAKPFLNSPRMKAWFLHTATLV